MVWKFCGQHSFCIVSGESPKTMWKLCLSTKLPHHEIRWNYDILRSDKLFTFEISTDLYEPAKKFSTISFRFKLFCVHQYLLTICKNLEQLSGNAIRNNFKLFQIHWRIHNNSQKCERKHSHLWKLLQIHKKLPIRINPQQLRSWSRSGNFCVFNRLLLLFVYHGEKLIKLKSLPF